MKITQVSVFLENKKGRGRLFGAEKVKESNAFSSVVAGLAIKAFNQSSVVE